MCQMNYLNNEYDRYVGKVCGLRFSCDLCRPTYMLIQQALPETFRFVGIKLERHVGN